MYLMAITNFDYIVITLFFALVFLISYKYRRKQQTTNKFLFGEDVVLAYQPNGFILGFGIIEFILLGGVGALWGISGILYVFIALLSSTIFRSFIAKTIYPDSIFQYLTNKVSKKFSAMYAIFSVILLILFISIASSLTSKIFLSLLGWNYVNSIFGITLLVLICLEVGGGKAVIYSRRVWLGVVAIAFIVVFILALNGLAPLGDKLANLKQLALSQGRVENFYTKFDLGKNIHLNNMIFISFFTLFIIPLISALGVNKEKKFGLFSLFKLLTVTIMIICGFLAVLTPAKNVLNGQNSKIITYQAQLPDGQIGYIVKTVDDKNSKASAIPGIIPPLLNAKTNLIEPNNYDYKLANIVLFKHYLPKQFLVLLIIVIMAGFMYTVSQFLVTIAKIVTLDICPSFGLLAEYGEEGSLWCARMSIIFAGGISLFGGYFLAKYLELTTLMNLVFSYSFVLALVLVAVVAIYERKK